MSSPLLTLRASVAVALSAVAALAASLPPAAGHDQIILSTRGDNALTVYDASSLAVEWSIDVGVGLHEIAVSPDGSFAIGAAYGSGPGHQTPDSRVAIIDLKAQNLAHLIDVGHPRPNDIIFITETRALVSAEQTGFVLEVDAETGEVVREISLDGAKAGHMLTAHAETNRAYVAHVVPGNVSGIDLAEGKVIKRIKTEPGSEGAALTPDGRSLWVSNHQSGSLSVVDTETLEVVETVACPGFPFRIRITPDGSKVIVSNPGTEAVDVYDQATRKRLGSIDLSPLATQPGTKPTPTTIAVGSDSKTATVVCAGIETIATLDLENLAIIHSIPAGPTPDGMTMYPLPNE